MDITDFITLNKLGSEFNIQEIEARDLYVVAETSENHHTGVTEIKYRYYSLIRGVFVKLTFDQFKSILNNNGYEISKEVYHYQFTILNTDWIKDYEKNYYRFWCGDYYENKFNPDDQSQLRYLFNKNNLK